ncbi:MAG: lysostaphin resistance A-like protein, partial [Planctomycetota bacterium]
DEESALRGTKALFHLQSQYLLGARDLVSDLGGGGTDAQYLAQATTLETGPPVLRLRAAVLSAELGGADAANDSLDRLAKILRERQVVLEPPEQRVNDLLRDLYLDGMPGAEDIAAMGEDEKELLRSELGWFGVLALHPPDVDPAAARAKVLAPTKRIAVVMIGAALGILVVLGLGFLGGCVFLYLALEERLKARFVPTNSPHGVYAETFAIWMLTYIALSALGALLGGGMALTVLAFVSSLAVLRWPVHRGVPWDTVRRDLGLHGGEGVLKEAAAGIACWAMCTPIVLAGALVTMVLAAFTAGAAGDPLALPEGPSHPIFAELAEGRMVPLLVFVAVVGAPVVEETFFRGALYGHLRASTARWPRFGSAVASGVAQGVLFAAVHPQGWTAIPVLTSLSLGFVLAREWRGTLLAPMAAHALNNGLVVTVALLCLRG